jgi:hypothetical protein
MCPRTRSSQEPSGRLSVSRQADGSLPWTRTPLLSSTPRPGGTSPGFGRCWIRWRVHRPAAPRREGRRPGPRPSRQDPAPGSDRIVRRRSEAHPGLDRGGRRRERPRREGRSPLDLARDRRANKLVKALKNAGAVGKPPRHRKLYDAVAGGDIDKVREALRAGADPHGRVEGSEPSPWPASRARRRSSRPSSRPGPTSIAGTRVHSHRRRCWPP